MDYLECGINEEAQKEEHIGRRRSVQRGIYAEEEWQPTRRIQRRSPTRLSTRPTQASFSSKGSLTSKKKISTTKSRSHGQRVVRGNVSLSGKSHHSSHVLGHGTTKKGHTHSTRSKSASMTSRSPTKSITASHKRSTARGTRSGIHSSSRSRSSLHARGHR